MKTDGTKTDSEPAVDVYIEEVQARKSIRIIGNCAVSYTKIFALLFTDKILLEVGISDRNLALYVDRR